MTTTYWSPNQAAVAQVETYTFSAPNSVGNTYNAAINGKTVTYRSISGDTAALAATGLYNLLNVSSGIAPELLEITFANPSDGVVTATAKVAGTPFANISGGSSSGLVLSTGNGLVNGITTAHTTANASPSDVIDAQNWFRVTAPAPPVRSLPQNGDDVVIGKSSVPLLWNLDQLAAVQFNTYQRLQSFTGTIGLPDINPGGYTEWRACYFKFLGPQGSVPAGGLSMILGAGSGSGPGRERYDLQSSQFTLTVLAAGQAIDDYGITVKGVHTANTFTLLGSTSLGIATGVGEIAGLSSCTVDGSATLGIGPGVAWTAGASLTLYGGTANLYAAPGTLTCANGAQVNLLQDALTWATVSAQGGSALIVQAGGTITTLTLTTSSYLDKSQDARALTITNSTIDGDTCFINDPLNAVVFTNATSVKQQVASGPIRFTGTRTVKVT